MWLTNLILLSLGCLTGAILGTLGSGGSILALPAFLYGAQIPVKSAIATSLVVVGTTSLIGAIFAQRRCNLRGCPGQEVDYRLTFWFALGGFFGTFGGSKLSHFFSESFQMLLFAGIMLTAALGMLLRGEKETPTTPSAKTSRPFTLVGLGTGIGVLTGVVGVGGGFLIVPALSLAAGVPVKRAANMSLWIIALNALVGVLGYVGRVPIYWSFAGTFVVGGLLGMLIGQRAVTSLSPKHLRQGFAAFLLLIGTFTLLQHIK